MEWLDRLLRGTREGWIGILMARKGVKGLKGKVGKLSEGEKGGGYGHWLKNGRQ